MEQGIGHAQFPAQLRHMGKVHPGAPVHMAHVQRERLHGEGLGVENGQPGQRHQEGEGILSPRHPHGDPVPGLDHIVVLHTPADIAQNLVHHDIIPVSAHFYSAWTAFYHIFPSAGIPIILRRAGSTPRKNRPRSRCTPGRRPAPGSPRPGTGPCSPPEGGAGARQPESAEFSRFFSCALPPFQINPRAVSDAVKNGLSYFLFIYTRNIWFILKYIVA